MREGRDATQHLRCPTLGMWSQKPNSWFKVSSCKALPHLVGLGEAGQKPPHLYSLGFFGIRCQSHMSPLRLAEHGSSPLQHVISTSRHLLRASQTEFGAGQREQKTHTPYSLLIAFLVTRIHGKGATRHQHYWPCARCCQISISLHAKQSDPFIQNSWRTRPSCYLASTWKTHTINFCPEVATSSLRAGGQSPGMHIKERDHQRALLPSPLLPERDNCTSGARQLMGTQHGAHQVLHKETWPLYSICKMLEA